MQRSALYTLRVAQFPVVPLLRRQPSQKKMQKVASEPLQEEPKARFCFELAQLALRFLAGLF